MCLSQLALPATLPESHSLAVIHCWSLVLVLGIASRSTPEGEYAEQKNVTIVSS